MKWLKLQQWAILWEELSVHVKLQDLYFRFVSTRELSSDKIETTEDSLEKYHFIYDPLL